MEQYISKSALLAEIEWLVNNYDKALDYEAALEDVRNFLDTLEVIEVDLQGEPQVKESAEIQHENKSCKENGNSLTKEPVSNLWHDMSEEAENGRNTIIIAPKDFYGAVLRKGGSQLRNHNKERYVKWAYIDGGFKFEKYGILKKDALAWLEKKDENGAKGNEREILTPDQARKAVEIAKEEVIEQTVEWLAKHAIKYYINSKGFIGTDKLVEDYKLIMTMKDV